MTHSRNLSDWCSQVMANFSEDEVWIGELLYTSPPPPRDPQEAEFEAPQFDFQPAAGRGTKAELDK